MSENFENVVDFLEDKVLKLLTSHELLQEEMKETQNNLQQHKLLVETLNKDLEVLRKKYVTLKSANALLGGNEHKIETKRKIDALIRQIDLCIAQLT